ncbi:MAG TPA: helix-turn-helix domain-containing protein [Hyphomonadaceae bacterium]|nr:helix-turn-helix domain-containing protein [Hyphomonadaceae bacterium]
MKGKRARSADKPTSSAQLDLFSRPFPPAVEARSLLVVEPVRPSVIAQERQQPAANTVDPLLDYILGASRGRGRPQKILNAVVASVAEPRRLLDVREAALRLGLSKSTLDKMRCLGRGPRFIRATDRAIRYDPADLEAFAAERRRQSTSQDAASAAMGA